jgi:hypothetical protein
LFLLNEQFIHYIGVEMSQAKENLSDLPQLRRKLILSLAINGLLPLIVYALLRPFLASDALALAIAGAIPALRTVVLWIGRRRVDWIGAYAVLGFSLALAITVILAGNAFLLEVHGSLLTGTVGLILLVSLAFRKPLLEPILRAFMSHTPQSSMIQESASDDPVDHQRLTERSPILTTVIGLALFGNALVHVILALTLPTATFLALSRLATLAILGGGAALLAWLRRRNTSLVGS